MLKIRRACSDDVNAIHTVLLPYFEAGIVLKRLPREILKNIDKFHVALQNDKIIGTVSYYDYGKNLYEIRSLAVEKNYKRKSAGKKLLLATIDFLDKMNKNSKIFTLTSVPEFFQKVNFKIVNKDTFPEKIWKDCQNCSKKDCCDEVALVYQRNNIM